MNWLLGFSVFLTASLLGGELCKKIRVSPLIGEITAGILFSIVFHLLSIQYDHRLLEVFSELGVIFILFVIGMETDLRLMLKVIAPAFSVACAGVAVPFLCGLLLGHWYGWSVPETLFVAASLVATSVTVSARSFHDLNFVKDRSSQVVLGAAVIDDILGLLVLTFVLAAVGGGGDSIFLKLTKMGSFFGLILPAVWFVLPKFLDWMESKLGVETIGIFSIAFLFFLSYVANWCGLAPIVGAFFLGIVLAVRHEEKVTRIVHPFFLLLAPIFFFGIGFQVELKAMVSGLGLSVVITVLAIASKAVGCFFGAAALRIPFKESVLIGVAMVPRGEVGLIIAGIGKTMGIVPDELFAAAAFMCLLTTLLPPFVLPSLIRWVKQEKAITH